MTTLKLLDTFNDILVGMDRTITFTSSEPGARCNLIGRTLTALKCSVFIVRFAIKIIANFLGA